MADSIIPTNIQTHFSSLSTYDNMDTNHSMDSNATKPIATSEKSEPLIKVEIPKITSKDYQHPHRPPSPQANNAQQLEQYGFMLNGMGAKREPNRLSSKIKTPELEENINKAKKYAMEQSVRYVLLKQQQEQQKKQLELIKKQQALLLMCRIYIGSIFYEVDEKGLRAAFSVFGPIKSMSMSWDPMTNKHKGFAFIEFETPEAAQLALEQMNGALLGGRNVKCGRPSNMPQAQPIIDQLTEDAKKYNRIYVASIHSDLSEQDVQSVFEAFGTIKKCEVVRDAQTNKHKNCGFIEYETIQSAQDAIAAMNLFDLGGQLLRVGKAVTPPEGIPSPTQPVLPIINTSLISPTQPQLPIPTAAALAAAAAINAKIHTQEFTSVNKHSHEDATPPPAKIPKVELTTTHLTPTHTPPLHVAKLEPQKNEIELTENQKKLLGMTGGDDSTVSLENETEVGLRGKEQRLILMQKLMQRKTESRVLVLRNMVGPDDVDEYLEEEITEECGKYGQVEGVVIYKEKQSENADDSETIVKIFVEFITSSSVQVAMNALNGRFFAGRVVKAEVYDHSAYLARDYSG